MDVNLTRGVLSGSDVIHPASADVTLSPFEANPTAATLVYTSSPFFNASMNASNASVTLDYACITIEKKPDVMLSHQVFLYSSLAFIIIGLIGNSLSILVFSSRNMRTVSSNFYLLVLAVSDSAYLVSVLLTKVLTTLRCLFFTQAPIDLFNRSHTWCVLLQFLLDLLADYSTCLILAFTVERYIACYHAVRFKEICTLRRARIVCSLLFLLCCVVIAPYHVLYMAHYRQFNVCTVRVEHEFEFTIWYIVEALVFRVIPVFIIAILNVFIIVKVSRLNRDRRKRAAASTANGSSRNKRASKEERQLTLMLILVSTSYIVVYLPVLIHFVMWKLQRSQVIVVSYQAMIIAQNYTRTFYISGFAINFFLYTLSGRVFRQQLYSLLCYTKKKKQYNCTTVGAETTTLVTKM